MYAVVESDAASCSRPDPTLEAAHDQRRVQTCTSHTQLDCLQFVEPDAETSLCMGHSEKKISNPLFFRTCNRVALTSTKPVVQRPKPWMLAVHFTCVVTYAGDTLMKLNTNTVVHPCGSQRLQRRWLDRSSAAQRQFGQLPSPSSRLQEHHRWHLK